MESRSLLSDRGRLSYNDSFTENSANGDYRFESSSAASSVNSFMNSTKSSQVPVHAYGATALSASGRASNVVLSDFDPFPVNMICPNCRKLIQTNIKYKAGRLTFVTGALIGVLTCGMGCWVPFCVGPLKDAYHYCPECGSTLGVYRRKTGCS